MQHNIQYSTKHHTTHHRPHLRDRWDDIVNFGRNTSSRRNGSLESRTDCPGISNFRLIKIIIFSLLCFKHWNWLIVFGLFGSAGRVRHTASLPKVLVMDLWGEMGREVATRHQLKCQTDLEIEIPGNRGPWQKLPAPSLHLLKLLTLMWWNIE